ncbi:hypothetical protein SUDANB126_00108 [Streptomyces sp. enrichment culture]
MLRRAGISHPRQVGGPAPPAPRPRRARPHPRKESHARGAAGRVRRGLTDPGHAVGILCEVPLSTEGLIYSTSPDGFAAVAPGPRRDSAHQRRTVSWGATVPCSRTSSSTGYRCPLYDGDALPADDPSPADRPGDHPHRSAGVTTPPGTVWTPGPWKGSQPSASTSDTEAPATVKCAGGQPLAALRWGGWSAVGRRLPRPAGVAPLRARRLVMRVTAAQVIGRADEPDRCCSDAHGKVIMGRTHLIDITARRAVEGSGGRRLTPEDVDRVPETLKDDETVGPGSFHGADGHGRVPAGQGTVRTSPGPGVTSRCRTLGQTQWVTGRPWAA